MKLCTNCRFEPEWQEMRCASGVTRDRGQCRFPTGAKQLRNHKLPQGATLTPPWVEKLFPKQNCGAWEPKEAE